MGTPDIEIPNVRQMSKIERVHAMLNTAMQSPEHMERWLEASGRKWIVLRGDDLIASLPWPEGVESFIQIVQAYLSHRSVIASGRTENMKHPATGEVIQVPIYKTDALEVEELDRAIRYLIGQITEIDPTWTLDTPPM